MRGGRGGVAGVVPEGGPGLPCVLGLVTCALRTPICATCALYAALPAGCSCVCSLGVFALLSAFVACCLWGARPLWGRAVCVFGLQPVLHAAMLAVSVVSSLDGASGTGACNRLCRVVEVLHRGTLYPYA